MWRVTRPQLKDVTVHSIPARTAQPLVEAFPEDTVPRYLLRRRVTATLAPMRFLTGTRLPSLSGQISQRDLLAPVRRVGEVNPDHDHGSTDTIR